MKIRLNNNIQILVREANYITTSSVNKLKVIDDGESVTAIISIGEILGTIKNLTLWNTTTSVTYTQIGNWIDSDVDARIIEILTNN